MSQEIMTTAPAYVGISEDITYWENVDSFVAIPPKPECTTVNTLTFERLNPFAMMRDVECMPLPENASDVMAYTPFKKKGAYTIRGSLLKSIGRYIQMRGTESTVQLVLPNTVVAAFPPMQITMVPKIFSKKMTEVGDVEGEESPPPGYKLSLGVYLKDGDLLKQAHGSSFAHWIQSLETEADTKIRTWKPAQGAYYPSHMLQPRVKQTAGWTSAPKSKKDIQFNAYDELFKDRDMNGFDFSVKVTPRTVIIKQDSLDPNKYTTVRMSNENDPTTSHINAALQELFVVGSVVEGFFELRAPCHYRKLMPTGENATVRSYCVDCLGMVIRPSPNAKIRTAVRDDIRATFLGLRSDMPSTNHILAQLVSKEPYTTLFDKAVLKGVEESDETKKLSPKDATFILESTGVDCVAAWQAYETRSKVLTVVEPKHVPVVVPSRPLVDENDNKILDPVNTDIEIIKSNIRTAVLNVNGLVAQVPIGMDVDIGSLSFVEHIRTAVLNANGIVAQVPIGMDIGSLSFVEHQKKRGRQAPQQNANGSALSRAIKRRSIKNPYVDDEAGEDA